MDDGSLVFELVSECAVRQRYARHRRDLAARTVAHVLALERCRHDAPLFETMDTLRALSDRLLRECGLATSVFHKRQCYYPLRVQALDLCWPPTRDAEPQRESNPLHGFPV